MKKIYLAWILPVLMMGNSCFAAFNVKVKYGNKKVEISIQKTDTIKQVKEKIKAKSGYDPKDQKLIFGGKFLEEPKKVSDYANIKENVTISLMKKSSVKPDPKFLFDVDVKYGEETIKIAIKGEDTIKEVKEKIQIKSGYRPEDQKLSLGNKDMEDAKQVTDYNAELEQHIEITLTPLGYTFNQKVAFALIGVAVIAGLLFGFFFFMKEEVDEAKKDAQGNRGKIKPKAVRA